MLLCFGDDGGHDLALLALAITELIVVVGHEVL